jgi:hypothetical protein
MHILSLTKKPQSLQWNKMIINLYFLGVVIVIGSIIIWEAEISHHGKEPFWHSTTALNDSRQEFLSKPREKRRYHIPEENGKTVSKHEIRSRSEIWEQHTNFMKLSTSRDHRYQTKALIVSDSFGKSSHPRENKGNRIHPCSTYDGVLHIQSGDKGAAAGTLFFQYIINQLIYAEMYNLIPFIHLNNITHNVYDEEVHGIGEGLFLTIPGRLKITMEKDLYHANAGAWPGKPIPVYPMIPEKLWFRGNGVWNDYLEPLSHFDPALNICQSLPYVTFTYAQLNPSMQFYAPWAVRSWEYQFIPPHLRHNTSSVTGLRDWFAPQRSKAHKVVAKYYRFRPSLWQAAVTMIPRGTNCLAVHIRHSDKGGLARKRIPHQQFLPYIDAYLQNGGDKVYIATDSSKVLDFVQKEWAHVNLVVQGGIVRSAVFQPVFRQASHNRTNTEVLIDILAMSRCQFFIHGYSAVSESSHYLNPNLHHHSVDLEDPDHIDANTFGELVKRGIS